MQHCHAESTSRQLRRTELMSNSTILGLLLTATLSLVAFPAPTELMATSDKASDPANREWNQIRGNVDGTATCDVAPILATPVELWREQFDGILCDPVAWSGVVFVVVKRGIQVNLVAFKIADGTPLGKKSLDKKITSVNLAVWQGTVAVVTPERIQLFRHKGKSFRPPTKIKGSWEGLPSVYRGLLLVSDASQMLHCIDIKKGKDLGASRAGYGLPAVVPQGEKDALIATVGYGEKSGYEGVHLYLHETLLKEFGSKKPSFVFTETSDHGTLADDLFSADWSHARAARFGETWFLQPAVGMATQGGGVLGGTIAHSGKLTPIVTPAAIYDGFAWGFDRENTLIKQQLDGSYSPATESDSLPKGAQPAAATIARNVMYVGNWAVDLKSSRVLWTLPAVETVSGLFPVGDERAVYTTKNDELICLGSNPATTGVVADSVQRPTSRPGAGSGVILTNGRHVAGEVEESGKYVLVGSAGKFPIEEVALIEKADSTRILGDEYPVYLAWWDAICADHVDGLEKIFDNYAKARLIDDCQRLLIEARVYGIARGRAEKLDAKLSGKSTNNSSNAEKQRNRILRKETKARAKIVQAIAAAAEWCQAADAKLAASVLLGGATDILTEGADLAEFLERAETLVPEAFPWRDAPDAVSQWLVWAEELLPAGAEFLKKDDSFRRRARGVWKEDAIALKTRNLVLWSRDHEPAIVGSCLRSGEAAIRALDEILPKQDGSRNMRLDVRIHKNREDYLAEETPLGTTAMPWSAGYFSPAEEVSRFYVTRQGENAEPMQRELEKVLAHELTHHYLATRWLPGRGGSAVEPGYWIVEGFARFIEDQVVEMGRLGMSFADETVKSLEACAQADAANKLTPAKLFVDFPQSKFVQLGDVPEVEVQLSNTLSRIQLTQRAMFYEQAGTLVFFMMNKRGPEGRARLIEYMRLHYLNSGIPKGWERLGFKSAKSLDRELKKFLAGLRE